MSETRSVTPYAAPEICDYGRLSVLTAFDGGGLHFAQVSLGSLPGGGSPGGVTTPGPGTGVLENTQSGGGATPDVPDSSAVNDTSSPSPGTSSGGAVPGSAGGGAGIGTGGESLPFTGMAVGPVAALGAGLTAAGATLRRLARRG
jgi:hypothetical protein